MLNSEFLPGSHVSACCSIPITSTTTSRTQSIAGHRQLTGVYLLGLARRMRGRLATFDRTIPLAAVVGATRNDIAVVAPAE